MEVVAEYRISREETAAIKDLYIERAAISDLLSSLGSSGDSHGRLLADFVDVSRRYYQWFEAFQERYSAVMRPECTWRVNFDTSLVQLVQNMPTDLGHRAMGEEDKTLRPAGDTKDA